MHREGFGDRVLRRALRHSIDLPVGFQNLVMVSDLQRYGWAGDRHAARSYWWIRPVPCQNPPTGSELVFPCGFSLLSGTR
jgi:hypothetical protein